VYFHTVALLIIELLYILVSKLMLQSTDCLGPHTVYNFAS